MIIHQIQQNGYYGGPIEVPDDTLGIPLWTTRTSPPPIPEGMYAVWNGGGWNITGAPAPEPTPEPTPEINNDNTL